MSKQILNKVLKATNPDHLANTLAKTRLMQKTAEFTHDVVQAVKHGNKEALKGAVDHHTSSVREVGGGFFAGVKNFARFIAEDIKKDLGKK